MTHVHDMIEIKAKTDAGFAIAFAILKHAEAIKGLKDALRTDHPLMGETFRDMALAIDNVAEAISNTKE